MYYWLVIIPMTMKLCHRGTVCPQKHLTYMIYMFDNNNKNNSLRQQNLYTNVYGYNLVVLAFLSMRLATLVHNTTLMSKPHLQVCKQQQTASGIKTCKLTLLPITWLC